MNTHSLSSLASEYANLANPDPAQPNTSPLPTDLPSTGLLAAEAEPRELSAASENQLIHVRLGIASGLFAALQAKHAPTAAHCLRVALGCSAWSTDMGLGELQRDEIEVAALLHDIGKISVPDSILRKPGALSQDEATLMARQRSMGVDIMSACCGDREILDIMQHCSTWYDGSHGARQRRGKLIPIGARMIAIVDAFDAMTTDHLYRKALSRERVVVELFENAPTQFDPDLVGPFAELYAKGQVRLDGKSARRWLRDLTPERSNRFWRLGRPSLSTTHGAGTEFLFPEEFVQSMHDAVVFVDERLRVFFWNAGAERLTGISAGSIRDRQWTPAVIGLRDDSGRPVADLDCPVLQAIRTGLPTIQRCHIDGRHGQRLPVEFHIVPVLDSDATARGVTLMLRDVSSEATLQLRVERLYKKATRDPLTGAANRAEFDRLHPEFVRTHLEQSIPCSLIMCDIDQFKEVNDRHGHQAGDEALIRLATLLRRSCRHCDLVARYGGDEFVMICADCGNGSATERADEVRRQLKHTPNAPPEALRITASFGVTELQSGDTAEAMLRRADRALLQAKSHGRNRVVQLGVGMDKTDAYRSSGWSHSATQSTGWLIDRRLITPVPLRLAARKLRGFVADHQSEIVSIDNNRVVMHICCANTTANRRQGDRPLGLIIDLTLAQHPTGGSTDTSPPCAAPRTTVHVIIRPQRPRDRRETAAERARQVLASLRSYLLAHDLP